MDDVPNTRRHSVAGAQDEEVDNRVADNQVGDAQEVDGREVVLQVVDVQGDDLEVVRREVALFPATASVGHLLQAAFDLVAFVLLGVFLLQAIEMAAHHRPEVVVRADDCRVDFPEQVEFQQ